jgi:hypothetical protein
MSSPVPEAPRPVRPGVGVDPDHEPADVDDRTVDLDEPDLPEVPVDDGDVGADAAESGLADDA